MNLRRAVPVFLLATLLLSSGCRKAGESTRLTAETYAKIQPGMTLAQVEELLGPGSKLAEPGPGRKFPVGAVLDGRPQESRYWWQGTKTVTVYFHTDDGKVVGKNANGLD